MVKTKKATATEMATTTETTAATTATIAAAVPVLPATTRRTGHHLVHLRTSLRNTVPGLLPEQPSPVLLVPGNPESTGLQQLNVTFLEADTVETSLPAASVTGSPLEELFQQASSICSNYTSSRRRPP
jgi:hypothetical protein